MIIQATDAQAKAILGSMLNIAQVHGGDGVSAADRTTLYSAARIVLGQTEDVATGVAPCGPAQLADATADDAQDRVQALRMLAVMSVVGKNAETFPGLDLTGMDEDRIKPFIPYRDGGADPDLVARYEALGGLAEAFTTRHDSSHVLSAYSTSPQGELLVSTFIGAMHPDHPMAAEVLPALYSYHLGIPMNKIAQVETGWFEPRKFRTAWERGAGTTTDVFEESWHFWSHVEAPLKELRHDYQVAPVDPALAA